jgi:DNA-binding NarL/FixJ family response regulator
MVRDGTNTAGGVGTPSTTIRTVLVDDCDDVRFVLATLLELDGRFEIVGEAANSIEAFDLVHAIQPDLVLVDLGLGRSHGAELIRSLRDRGNETPLAVVTGSPHPSDHQAALEAGADSVHRKESLTTTLTDELVGVITAPARRRPARTDPTGRRDIRSPFGRRTRNRQALFQQR